jgi:two-component system LytT family response regulator
MQQFFIPTNKGIRVVMAENIVRIQASSNYCKIFFDNEHPLTVAKVLKWFEEKLPGDCFYRIHRTHIVNRRFISNILCNKTLTLINGEHLQISRRKKKICKKWRLRLYTMNSIFLEI